MSHARYALSDDEDDAGAIQYDQPSSSYASVKEEGARAPSPLPFAVDVKEEVAEPPSIVQLAHAWVNERGAPEVQAWDSKMVERVMDQIAQQQSILDSLVSDASTSEEEHFRLNLVQLDVERAKWILRSYLRARLVKVGRVSHQIERHAAYIMAHQAERQRLSDAEVGYANR